MNKSRSNEYVLYAVIWYAIFTTYYELKKIVKMLLLWML